MCRIQGSGGNQKTNPQKELFPSEIAPWTIRAMKGNLDSAPLKSDVMKREQKVASACTGAQGKLGYSLDIRTSLQVLHCLLNQDLQSLFLPLIYLLSWSCSSGSEQISSAPPPQSASQHKDADSLTPVFLLFKMGS